MSDQHPTGSRASMVILAAVILVNLAVIANVSLVGMGLAVIAISTSAILALVIVESVAVFYAVHRAKREQGNLTA